MDFNWQRNKIQLKQRVQHLLETGLWSDCAFSVDDKDNLHIFYTHKLILAISSPVFEAMFFRTWVDKTEYPIPIRDIQPDIFQSFLQYVYTDEFDFNSFDEVSELCYVAKKYLVPHLFEKCIDYLKTNIRPDNVCHAYELGEFFEEPLLVEKALQVIRIHTPEVLNHCSFEDATLNTLSIIFSQKHLNIESELILFQALSRYVAQHVINSNICTKENEMETDATNGAVSSNEIHATESEFQVKARDLLKQIRFLTLTLEQFSTGVGSSNLLTADEKKSLLMNIVSERHTADMPEGFSVSRENRSLSKDLKLIELMEDKFK